MKPILLIGGGGHCRSCIDVIEAEGTYQIQGIVQPVSDGKEPVLGYPVLGCDDDLPYLLERITCALVTVGQIKSPAIRIKLYGTLKNNDASLPVIVSPNAYKSGHASVAEGTILMHGSVVNARARIGANCIINSQALIEHDAEIGPHCHISTGARVNGGAKIGSGSFVGSGAVLKEGINLGERVVIGAGQVILHDVPDGTTVSGRND